MHVRTKQKFSRKFLQSILDGIQDPIRIVDENYQIVFINKAATKAVGKPFDEIVGKKCFDLFYHLQNPCPHCLTEWTFSTGRAGSTPFVKEMDDGAKNYYELFSFPITNGSGEVEYVIELVKDITQRKKLEEQLVSSERLASMGEIAATIAHEINNPIGIILGFSQDLLSEAPQDSKEYKVLKVIEEEAKRCGRVVRGLLDLAKPATPQFSFVKIEEIVEKSIILLEPKISKGGIAVVKRYTRTLPLVKGDPQQIQQVFVNVLLNAIEAMPDGGKIALSVTSKNSQEGKRWVSVVISDTGIGISKEDLSRVFLPFFSKGKKKGTGLGLSISKRIVESHGGTIEMESAFKKGTTCVIRLPVTEGSRL